MARRLSHDELLRLKRWNTATVYHGWEQSTRHDRTKGCGKGTPNAADRVRGPNLEETRDFMPQIGPLIGYAVTVVIEPSHPDHAQILQELDQAAEELTRKAAEKYGREGER